MERPTVTILRQMVVSLLIRPDIYKMCNQIIKEEHNPQCLSTIGRRELQGLCDFIDEVRMVDDNISVGYQIKLSLSPPVVSSETLRWLLIFFFLLLLHAHNNTIQF